MKKNSPSHFKLQRDQHDCGVVCLRNVLAYHKAEISLEKLREWSESGHQGATLPGLHHAASQVGFKVRGARAESVPDLRNLLHPCILQVTLEGQPSHYVVYYPTKSLHLFLIGDPAKGLVYLYAEELEKIWKGHTLLLLEPGEQLAQWQRQKKWHRILIGLILLCLPV